MSICLQPVDLSLSGWTPTTLQADNIENGVGEEAKKLATPLKSLTSETIDGTGAFDVLMRSTKLHLQAEYEAGRITGADYATVYLGALTAVLQTSIQFLLNEQQVHRLAAEIGLIRQQTVTELTNTEDNIPVGLGFNHSPVDIVTIPSLGQGVPN
jgi:hypothetical protein